MTQQNLIRNFNNPILIRIILTACYNGNWTPSNTRRSFVQGLRAYMHQYGYDVPAASFLNTIPHEAYAMAATAVSPGSSLESELILTFFRFDTG